MLDATNFEIPAGNLARLQATIAELAKRQARIAARGALNDYTPIALVVGESVVRETKQVIGWANNQPIERIEREVFYRCTVTGSAPRLAGWTFAATLQHEGEGTILRSVPGVEADLTPYRNVAPSCDHCRVNRRRADTFVVVNEQGETRQVGRSCLADFTGCQSPERAARMAEILASVREACQSCMGGARSEQVAEPLSFLAMVACSMRQFGWTSRTAARDSFLPKEATADHAWLHLLATDQRLKERGEERMVPEPADLSLAADALLWAAEALEREGLSDYEHNLRVSLAAGVVRSRTAGIAGSLLAAYQRAQGELRRKAEREQEQHVAAPTGRVEFAGEVVSVKTVEGEWGVSRKMTVKVRDAAGATWLCWCTMPVGLDSENGKVVELVGRRVRLAATLQAGRDAHFAFGKRPAGRLLADDEPDLAPVSRKRRARKAPAAPAPAA
jgi:hypothetical protein